MQPITSAGAAEVQITLRKVRLSKSIVIDELVLESSDLEFDATKESISAGETKFRGLITEVNLNAILASDMPAASPVRNLTVTLFSGRAQFKGHFVKSVMSLPFTLDAKPMLTNGIRLWLDCSGSHVGGIGLPGPIVELIEKLLNERLSIDLTEAPFPVRLDEIRCEPGRLNIAGKAKLGWPLPAVAPPTASALL